MNRGTLAYGQVRTVHYKLGLTGASVPRHPRVAAGSGDNAIEEVPYEEVPFQRWPDPDLFESIQEVQDFATRWLWAYNHERPNMALGGITPKQKLALAA